MRPTLVFDLTIPRRDFIFRFGYVCFPSTSDTRRLGRTRSIVRGTISLRLSLRALLNRIVFAYSYFDLRHVNCGCLDRENHSIPFTSNSFDEKRSQVAAVDSLPCVRPRPSIQSEQPRARELHFVRPKRSADLLLADSFIYRSYRDAMTYAKSSRRSISGASCRKNGNWQIGRIAASQSTSQQSRGIVGREQTATRSRVVLSTNS